MLESTHTETVIFVGIAATYCEELAACLEAAQQKEGI